MKDSGNFYKDKGYLGEMENALDLESKDLSSNSDSVNYSMCILGQVTGVSLGFICKGVN